MILLKPKNKGQNFTELKQFHKTQVEFTNRWFLHSFPENCFLCIGTKHIEMGSHLNIFKFYCLIYLHQKQPLWVEIGNCVFLILITYSVLRFKCIYSSTHFNVQDDLFHPRVLLYFLFLVLGPLTYLGNCWMAASCRALYS